METFVITVTAKPGCDQKVADFYTTHTDQYKNAKGFRGIKILRAKAGAHYNAVKKRFTAEEMAKHPEGDHGPDAGVAFVILESWDSIDDRMNFAMNRDKTPDRELFPNLLPEHSHEFFEDITPG